MSQFPQAVPTPESDPGHRLEDPRIIHPSSEEPIPDPSESRQGEDQPEPDPDPSDPAGSDKPRDVDPGIVDPRIDRIGPDL